MRNGWLIVHSGNSWYCHFVPNVKVLGVSTQQRVFSSEEDAVAYCNSNETHEGIIEIREG